MLIKGVAVEKVVFPKKSRKSGDRKCLGDWGKSFAELPDAKQFLRVLVERVFQQPQGLSPPISIRDNLRTMKRGCLRNHFPVFCPPTAIINGKRG
jgi:hypothetical protein